jgi:hypothetical protein
MAKREIQKDQVSLYECNRMNREWDKQREEQMTSVARAAHRAVDVAFRRHGGGGSALGGEYSEGREQKNLRAQLPAQTPSTE